MLISWRCHSLTAIKCVYPWNLHHSQDTGHPPHSQMCSHIISQSIPNPGLGHLLLCFLSLQILLERTSYKWSHMIYTLLCWDSFPGHIIDCVYQQVAPFCCSQVLRHMDVTWVFICSSTMDVWVTFPVFGCHE